MGAWNGVSEFDDYWISNLEIKDVIIEIADDLNYAVENGEDSDMFDGNWERKYCYAKR